MKRLAIFVTLLVCLTTPITSVSAGKWRNFTGNEIPIRLIGWPKTIIFRYNDRGLILSNTMQRYDITSVNDYIKNKTFFSLNEVQEGIVTPAPFTDRHISDYPFFTIKRGYFNLFSEAQFKPDQKMECDFAFDKSCSFFKVDFTLEGNECSFVSYIASLDEKSEGADSNYDPIIYLIHCGNVKPFTKEHFKIDFKEEIVTILYPDRADVQRLEEANRERREKEKAQQAAEAKRKADHNKALNTALASTAEAHLSDAQEYLSVNPATPGLLDIVTSMASTKAALKERKGSAVKIALASLRTTLSREKGFSEFMAKKNKKRQKKLAAQVKSIKDDLKSYAAFLKRQIVLIVMSKPEVAQVLVSMIKSLEGGLSSNDLSALTSLKNKAIATLKTHNLHGQYAEVQKMLATARNKEEAKKRREK